MLKIEPSVKYVWLAKPATSVDKSRLCLTSENSLSIEQKNIFRIKTTSLWLVNASIVEQFLIVLAAIFPFRVDVHYSYDST